MEEGNLTDCWKIGEAITKPQSLLINPDWGSFYERYLRGELLLSLGDLDNAERYYRANLGQPPDKFIKWISTLGMAKVEMRRGKFKTCRQTLEAIAQESADSGFELIVQGARAELIRLSLYQEDPQSITKIFMHYGPSIKQSEYKGIRILAAVLEGRGYLQQGKIEEAKKHLSRALEEARESRYFWLHLDALKSLIEAGVDQEANRKEAKRMILQAEFNCEIPELSKALEDYKKRWR
jgi:tetratricopeptide (TPR) repeat protein